jgi:hypothetical protein
MLRYIITKIAFCTCYRYYKYIVIPFSLTNAPITFQNYIYTTLYNILNTFIVAYLDNILIFLVD